MLTDEERSIFGIAYILRIPVYQLMKEMPYEELLGWQQFFREKPPGHEDDYRISALMRVMGFKGDVNSVFPSLAAASAAAAEGRNVANTLKRSFIYQLMQSSSGGERLEL